MPAVTIRNLSAETHRALEACAAAHGCGLAAKVRAILEDSLAPQFGFGTKLVAPFQRDGGVELEIIRDRSAAQPIRFE